MNASQLIYCKSSSKRVLLVSKNPHTASDLEGILQQIQMPDATKVLGWEDLSLSFIKAYDPHLLVLDSWDTLSEFKIQQIHLSNPALPIICLYEELSNQKHKDLLAYGVQKLIKRDTLRFCGQIFYRSIHGYAIHAYYQKQMKTQKQIEKNIKGLEGIQAFWDQSAQPQDASYQKIMNEISTTLDYLNRLQTELAKESKRRD